MLSESSGGHSDGILVTPWMVGKGERGAAHSAGPSTRKGL